MSKHPITKRNTGSCISRKVLNTGISFRKQEKLTSTQARLIKLRARTAKITAISAVARVGEDHLGGSLGIVDPLEMTLSVLERDKGDDFFIAHGHTASGYFGALAAHGYVSSEDVINGFRNERPIGGHITPIAGGTLNTGRLGDESAGVGMAAALKALKKDGIIFLHTSDGSANQGSFMEALEFASAHKLPVIIICDVNGLQLSGTTHDYSPCSHPRQKAVTAGWTVLDIPSLHQAERLFRVLHRAAKIIKERKGPVFINPTGFFKRADQVFREKGYRGFQAQQKIWIPGSLMGSGIREWELNIIESLNNERLNKPMKKKANYHDGNMKKLDTDKIISKLALSKEEEKFLKANSKSTKAYTFYARPKANQKTGLTMKKTEFFPVSCSCELKDGKTPSDWISPRKGIFRGLSALGQANPRDLLAFGVDLEGSTQIQALMNTIDTRNSFQAGIQERGGILAAAGAAYKMLKESASKKRSKKTPIVTTGTFASFLFSTGMEGLEFINYQEDIDATIAGLPVKIICSHSGMNPGKDGLTAQYMHAIDASYNLPRMKRVFLPADPNHAIHIIRELYSKSDYAMYIGPRGETPIIKKGTDAFYGSSYKFQAVDKIRSGKDVAFLVTGPILYRVLCAVDILRKEKGIKASVYYVGCVKPFPAKEIKKIMESHRAVVTVEDGFVGEREGADRGLAGLVSGFGMKGLKKVPSFGKVGNHSGETMSQSPEEIYDRFGLNIRKDIVQTALKALAR